MPRNFPDAPFTFGDAVQDRITGYKGIVTAETRWLNQCHTFNVQPREIPEGKTPKDIQSTSFDMVRLVKTDDERIDFPGAEIADPFPLGTRVQCKYTGFKGIAYAHSRFVYGSSRVAILAEKLKKDQIIEPMWFDEEQLVILASAEAVEAEKAQQVAEQNVPPPAAAEPERRRGSGGPIDPCTAFRDPHQL
jgi:hypothetical protein